MGKIRDRWYRLVAGGLLQAKKRLATKLARQIEITAEHAAQWRIVQRQFIALKDDMKKILADRDDQIVILKEHVKAAKEGRTDDVETAKDIIRERMGMDPDAPGKMDILRKQLRQECAYVMYLEDNLEDGLTEFNDIPKEERKVYFERVDERAR